MLCGLLIYLSGQRDLPPNRGRSVLKRQSTASGRAAHLCGCSYDGAVIRNVLVASRRSGNYNLWARDHVNLSVYGWAVQVRGYARSTIWLRSYWCLRSSGFGGARPARAGADELRSLLAGADFLELR